MFRNLMEYLLILFMALGLIGILLTLNTSCTCLSTGSGRPPAGSTGHDLPSVGSLLPGFSAMPTFLLIGFVLSVVGIGLGFGKLGGVTAIACVSGLLLQSALSVPWLSALAAIFLLCAMGIVVAGILLKNKALKEIIKGVQEYRSKKEDNLDKALASKQSSYTEQVVKKIKATLTKEEQNEK
jgi:hypothetical protein